MFFEKEKESSRYWRVNWSVSTPLFDISLQYLDEISINFEISKKIFFLIW